MQQNLSEIIKIEIENKLNNFLGQGGLKIYIAANDNIDSSNVGIAIEGIENIPLCENKLISEIRVRLAIFACSRKYDALLLEISRILHPYNLNFSEAVILLSSIHIEKTRYVEGNLHKGNAKLRYIVEHG